MKHSELFREAELADDIEKKLHFLEVLLNDVTSEGIERHYRCFVQSEDVALRRILGKGLLRREPELVPFLLMQLASTKEEQEIANILHLIGLTYNRAYIPIVLPYLECEEYDIRYKAIIAMGWLGDESLFPILEKHFYQEQEIELRCFCITAMEQILLMTDHIAEERLASVEEDFVRFLEEVVLHEEEESILAVSISALQELIDVDFGLFVDEDTGCISGDVYAAKDSVMDYIKDRKVMIKNKQALIEQLYASRLMQTDEEYRLFEEALNQLYEDKDGSSIDVFIHAFDDETEGFDVMFGMLHMLESYDKILGSDEWTACVLRAVVHFRQTAKEWEETVYLRMLNSEKHYMLLVEQLHKQDEVVQSRMKEILIRIRARNPEKFKEKCDALLAILV